ncbi:MAG: leucine-rich repeat protein [Oscillospiraceae bacterium]|jgi:hypothetical protein|nr:leucine-rich repeat protein [Oscillospiraceae bacterium]
MKKIISLILSVVMVLTMCPIIGSSAYSENFQVGVLTYTVRIDGTLKITRCEEDATKAEIEQAFAELEESDFSVTTIGHWVYDDFLRNSVTLPPTVTEIGFFECDCHTNPEYEEIYDSEGNLIDYVVVSETFVSCDITSITFPDSVTKIGSMYFSECENIKTITFPNSVTSIGEMYFSKCENLTSVNIPNGVTTIDSYAFENCTSLTSVNIPNSVTTISGSAFSGCTSLTSINLPDSVTYIGDRAFNGSQITDFTTPPYLEYLGEDALNNNSILRISGYVLRTPSYNYQFYGNFLARLIAAVCADYDGTSDTYSYTYNGDTYSYTYDYDSGKIAGNDPCDINNDGRVSAVDVILFQKNMQDGSLENEETPTDDSKKAAEYNLTKGQFEKPFSGQKAETTVPESVPGFGGKTISLNLEVLNNLAVSFEIMGEDDGKTAVIVGYGVNGLKCGKTKNFDEYKKELEKKLLEEWKLIPPGEKDEDEGPIQLNGNGALKLVYNENKELESYTGTFNIVLGAAWEFKGTAWVPIPPIVISVPVYLEAGISFEGSLSGEIGYDFLENEITSSSGMSISSTGEVNLMLGLGVTLLNAGVYGTLTFKSDYGILPVPYIKEWGLSGELGLKAKILMFDEKIMLCNGSFFKYTQGGPDEKGEWELTFAKELEKQLNNLENFQTIQNPYLTESADLIDSENLALISNAYGYIEPQIVTYNGTTIMVYADVDSSRDTFNQQRLYYRVLGSEGWTAPSALDNNSTYDGEFSLKTGNDGIYIAYEEGKRLFTAEDEIADVASQIEISTAKWNGNYFTDFKTITDNNVYDFNPQVVFNNGNFSVAYLTNSENNVFTNDTANSLNLYEVKYERSRTYLTESNMITSYAFCDGDWVALVDTDNDYTTPQTDLYYNSSYSRTSGNFTNVQGSDLGYGFFLSNGGYLATFEGDTVDTTDVYVGSEFEFNNLNSKAIISYVAADEAGTSLYYVQYVGGISEPVALVNSDNYIDSYDLYFSDGIKTAYLETFADLSGDFETYSEFLTTGGTGEDIPVIVTPGTDVTTTTTIPITTTTE